MKINFSFTKPTKIHRITRAKVHEFINPQREWTLGLLGATLLLIGGAVYIGADLRAQFNNELTVTETEETTLTYNKAEVVEEAKRYKENEERFNGLRKERPAVVVPVPPPVVEVTEGEQSVLSEDPIPTGEIILQ